MYAYQVDFKRSVLGQIFLSCFRQDDDYFMKEAWMLSKPWDLSGSYQAFP